LTEAQGDFSKAPPDFWPNSGRRDEAGSRGIQPAAMKAPFPRGEQDLWGREDDDSLFVLKRRRARALLPFPTGLEP